MNEVLEEVIHVNENETILLKKANRHWNMFLISLFNICMRKLQDLRNLIQVENNRERSSCCCLGLDYAKGWDLN
jgi:hypothetical protein